MQSYTTQNNNASSLKTETQVSQFVLRDLKDIDAGLMFSWPQINFASRYCLVNWWQYTAVFIYHHQTISSQQCFLIQSGSHKKDVPADSYRKCSHFLSVSSYARRLASGLCKHCENSVYIDPGVPHSTNETDRNRNCSSTKESWQPFLFTVSRFTVQEMFLQTNRRGGGVATNIIIIFFPFCGTPAAFSFWFAAI